MLIKILKKNHQKLFPFYKNDFNRIKDYTINSEILVLKTI